MAEGYAIDLFVDRFCLHHSETWSGQQMLLFSDLRTICLFVHEYVLELRVCQ